MTSPLVSIVIPTHNRVASLKRAIESVLAQTVQDFEIIIVDDASADGTPMFLAEISRGKECIKYITNNTSLGGGGARNVGINSCKGKWIAFLDDDDEWVPKKLELQLKKLNAHPNTVACSGSYKHIFPSGISKVKQAPVLFELDNLLKGNNLGGTSLCICSRKVLIAINGFDAKLRSGQDWDLWVRMSLQGDIVSCEEVLVLYYAHHGIRITQSMEAQYTGIRRFYFKNKYLMNKKVQQYLILHIFFIMSRQKTRALRYRVYYLQIAIFNSPFKEAFSYLKSSGLRIMLDIITRK